MDIPSVVDVLIVKDGQSFVAQCIEHDIAAQGMTPHDALYDLTRTLAGHVLLAAETQYGFENIPPAPDRFRRWFDESKPADYAAPLFKLPTTLPPEYAIPKQISRVR